MVGLSKAGLPKIDYQFRNQIYLLDAGVDVVVVWRMVSAASSNCPIAKVILLTNN